MPASANVRKIDVEYDANLFTRRGHRRISAKIMRQLARRHKDRRIKKHFENIPETRPGSGGYRYEQRSVVWQERKLRETGQNKPLVYRGHLRASVLSSSKITSTATRWNYTAKAPFRIGGVSAPRRDELEAVSNREVQDDTRLFKKLYILAGNSPVFHELRRQRIRS